MKTEEIRNNLLDTIMENRKRNLDYHFIYLPLFTQPTARLLDNKNIVRFHYIEKTDSLK